MRNNRIFVSMCAAKSFIRNANRILLIGLVLLALGPCVVKEALFSVANTAYTKPLNKTRAIPTNACQYVQHDNQQLVKESNRNRQIESSHLSDKYYVVARSTKIAGKYWKTFSGNSPPKYILYKRLKIDVV